MAAPHVYRVTAHAVADRPAEASAGAYSRLHTEMVRRADEFSVLCRSLPGMRLLLTSAGIKNASIHDALVGLLGKPIAESNALCIPTAGYGHPRAVLTGHGGSSADGAQLPHVRAGLEVLGSAGAHRAAQHRRRALGPLVRETDVLLVNGGDALYLCHWMRQSGLADLLPSLRGRSGWD